MNTKIAVIGSAEFIDSTKSVADQVADIELDFYMYQQPQEALKLLKQLMPCDAVFLSGALPYYFSKDYHEQLRIPVFYLVQDEMTIASSLLAALYHKKILLERISIDLFDAAIVSNVLTAVDIEATPMHVMDYEHFLRKDLYDFNQLVSFHQSLWEKGEIDLAITSVHAVYNQLHHLGIPVMRMADPKTALIRGLENAKEKAEYKKSKASQAAVGYISIHSVHQRKKLESFAHAIHATVQEINDSLFALYCTRGDIEALNSDVLQQLFTETEETAVGFGYGVSIKDANKNAMIALSFAEKDQEKDCCYILTESKELLGPFPHKKMQQKLVNTHPDLYLIAQKAKLSPANLSKMIEFAKNEQMHHFTSADLADYLQVTRRSAERMIKKLSDHGYIQIIGEEMTYQQGRPRALYKLNIPIYF
ncbi:helix-turn-helix domain-containing protein [Cytobacillus dafuensis]|uniref:HTH domain-containing protein n=1 Tax=Cytobacillus dafuensis TaxID=1742359 RepID=A0A5B8Z1D7_CYTDA|nr:HTH domain-containing protein [Cytobacillus dafuensis]QED46822.1 HTH domain-containing protein [Cytobacillus dafuensis]